MHPNLADLHINSIGHYGRVAPVHTRRPRPTDWLLVWAPAGDIRGTIGGQHFVADPARFVLMPPGKPQDYFSPAGDRWEWLWAHFDGPAAAAWAERFGLAGGGVGRSGMDVSRRRRWLDLVSTYVQEPELARVRLAALLADLPAGGDDGDGFAEVRRYVQEHLAEPLTAARLAEVTGMSVPHFNRRFKAAAGVSPMRFVAARRVERAGALLAGSDLKLTAVGAAVGYPDPFHFSRVYKRHTGRPPTADRR